ncbi:TKL family protein kinase [Reticulomyxa filosa]|uniref:TKL family protein kinase n=1 Tax=Reticulomyxa filosa TaxID=46433 RepID=X6MF31_RETFI|nr:TKL family protein kinase [Reticulomyxa filosa]|eukprot:ETO11655.1 TKL family protein kinase [Reticulomyxa filosa]
MEYLNGGSMEVVLSLTHRDSKRHYFTFREVVGMMCQAAKGILHLHKANIVHRDIAARNILLEYVAVNESKGSRVRAVVSDFGLSRIAEQGADRQHYTENNVGPIKWMSPESIVTNGNVYNTKTDAYSFGIMMWEVFAGSEPYPNLTKTGVAAQVLHKKCRPFVPIHWPTPLAYLIQRCWQYNPDFRPSFFQIVSQLSHLSGIMDTCNVLTAPECIVDHPSTSPHTQTQVDKSVSFDISQLQYIRNYKLPSVLHSLTTATLVELPELIQIYHPNDDTKQHFPNMHLDLSSAPLQVQSLPQPSASYYYPPFFTYICTYAYINLWTCVLEEYEAGDEPRPSGEHVIQVHSKVMSTSIVTPPPITIHLNQNSERISKIENEAGSLVTDDMGPDQRGSIVLDMETPDKSAFEESYDAKHNEADAKQDTTRLSVAHRFSAAGNVLQLPHRDQTSVHITDKDAVTKELFTVLEQNAPHFSGQGNSSVSHEESHTRSSHDQAADVSPQSTSDKNDDTHDELCVQRFLVGVISLVRVHFYVQMAIKTFQTSNYKKNCYSSGNRRLLLNNF